MAGDLVVDVAIHLPRTNNAREPKQEDPQASHEGVSESFRKRSTMLAARIESAVLNEPMQRLRREVGNHPREQWRVQETREPIVHRAPIAGAVSRFVVVDMRRR
jgi:hypothetical protein